MAIAVKIFKICTEIVVLNNDMVEFRVDAAAAGEPPSDTVNKLTNTSARDDLPASAEPSDAMLPTLRKGIKTG